MKKHNTAKKTQNKTKKSILTKGQITINQLATPLAYLHKMFKVSPACMTCCGPVIFSCGPFILDPELDPKKTKIAL